MEQGLEAELRASCASWTSKDPIVLDTPSILARVGGQPGHELSKAKPLRFSSVSEDYMIGYGPVMAPGM